MGEVVGEVDEDVLFIACGCCCWGEGVGLEGGVAGCGEFDLDAVGEVGAEVAYGCSVFSDL